KPFAKVGLTFADKIPGIPLGKDQYRALDIDNTVTDNDINAFDVTESDLKTYREYLNLKG
ncbi:MAG: complex I NDUFA9 subunit family protein, partial [Halobacteriaceae archaeon]